MPEGFPRGCGLMFRGATPCAMAAVEAAIHRNPRRVLPDLRLLIPAVEHYIYAEGQTVSPIKTKWKVWISDSARPAVQILAFANSRSAFCFSPSTEYIRAKR